MIAALALPVILQAAAATPAQSTTPSVQRAGQLPAAALFLFYRARYFHEMAEVRPCARAAPQRMRALDARYDAVKGRLIALGSAIMVTQGGSQGPDRGEDPDCRQGATLAGYAKALDEIERNLVGAGQ